MDRRGTRTRSRGRRGLALGLGTALLVGAGAVAVDVVRAPQAAAAPLTAFDGCDELVSWYREATLPHVTAYGLDGGWGSGPMLAMEAAADSSTAGTAGSARAAATSDTAVGASGTGTNVQEAGVDEPSRIKVADGLAYTLAADRLVVVDVGTGTVVGEVDLAPAGPSAATGTPEADLVAPERWFSELLLVDRRVVVLGSGTLPPQTGEAAGPGTAGRLVGGDAFVPGGPSTTTATTVDVADPAAPVVVDEVEVEGSYVSARASAGDVRLVTSASPWLPFVDPWLLQQDAGGSVPLPQEPQEPQVGGPSQDPSEDEALARNQQVVQDATVADWLPDLVERDEAGQVTARSPVDCAGVAHPDEEAGAGTVTVLTLDPSADGPTLAGTTSVSADGSTVYASPDRLYVATTAGGWTWGRPGGGTSTDLHGFDTTQPGRTEYLGSGSVDGWLLGSWAMDAHDGHLRVGTTSDVATQGPEGTPSGDGTRPAPAGGTSSSVVVLQETGTGLEQVGRVDGLGPGEQIRSLRWFDELAVVVTFEQTDPLYTVDLADPAAPELLGELKVLGYSGYLHPVGDDLLLGVGQDGTEDGQLLGAKVETYDIGDLSAPTDLDTVGWPDSSSPVEWDSRLFSYLPEQRTAVLALERYAGGSYATGLVAVSVAEDGSLEESGAWLRRDGGPVVALATAGDRVLVSTESWSQTDPQALPTALLTVLDADGLGVVHEVPLG